MSQYYKGRRKTYLYIPGTLYPFRISRSKIDLFLNCPRCFYLDRRLGVAQPPGYPFSLNSAVDKLLKYKRRPEGKAVSIAVSDKAMAEKYVDLNIEAQNIYKEFLPGPITVISKTKNMLESYSLKILTLNLCSSPASPKLFNQVLTLTLSAFVSLIEIDAASYCGEVSPLKNLI